MSDLFDFLAICVSGAACFVTIIARQDAKRSANAAEESVVAANKSADEAEKEVRLSLASLLEPHFTNVDYIFDAIEKKKKTQKTTEKHKQATDSVTSLKNYLRNDSLNNLLDEAIGLYNDTNKMQISSAALSRAQCTTHQPTLAEHIKSTQKQEADIIQQKRVSELRSTYEEIKNTWINISTPRS